MRTYELTYMVSDRVPENELGKVSGKISGFITKLGGEVIKEEPWGRRKLAYPIKKQDFATYITLNFKLEADKVLEFERDLRLSEEILRHLLITQDYGNKAITLSSEEIADTEEIQKAIGGERSFEIVEGETEASKDLMAVRENKEEKGEALTVEEDEIPADTVAPENEEAAIEETAEVKEIPEKKEKKEQKEELEKAEEEKSASNDPSADEEKPKKAKKSDKKDESEETETERLSKLNEKLDDILGDEL